MNVEVVNRRSYSAIAGRNKLQPGLQGQLDVVSVLIVFNLLNNTSFVIECSAMACEGSVRMEVRHEHVTTGHANTTEFSISREGIAEMAENKPAPHHVKLAGLEWHFANVSSNNGVQASCCKHLGA